MSYGRSDTYREIADELRDEIRRLQAQRDALIRLIHITIPYLPKDIAAAVTDSIPVLPT